VRKDTTYFKENQPLNHVFLFEKCN